MNEHNLSTLKIHRLAQEQYDRELAAGRIDENAIYLTPDEGIDLSNYATKDQLEDKVDKVIGKDLSTNDYTTEEKNKLARIQDGAQVNQNAFTEFQVDGVSKPAISPNSSVDIKAGQGISINMIEGKNATYQLDIANAGVLEVTTGTVNGTISVTTPNSTTNVQVKGLDSAAYTSASAYDAAGAADEALESAKEYTNTSIANLINSAPETLDTIGELAAAMEENDGVVNALNQAIANKADNSTVTQLQETVNAKAENSALNEHTSNTTIHITAVERAAWNSKMDGDSELISIADIDTICGSVIPIAEVLF